MTGRKPTTRGKGAWLFLGVMVLIYAITALLDMSVAKQAVRFFAHVFVTVLPVVGVVFLLMLLLNLVLTPERVKTYLGAASGLKGWLLAIVSGVLASGPIYAWYAVLHELRKEGMKTSLAAAFLYSRAVKLPLLPLLAHYFGTRFMVVLSLYLIVFSVLSGIVTGALTDKARRKAAS